MSTQDAGRYNRSQTQHALIYHPPTLGNVEKPELAEPTLDGADIFLSQLPPPPLFPAQLLSRDMGGVDAADMTGIEAFLPPPPSWSSEAPLF